MTVVSDHSVAAFSVSELAIDLFGLYVLFSQ